jgi:hypothetical protein
MELAIRSVAALAWLGVTILIFLLWRIALFYERSSGQRSHSYLFIPPLFLLPAAAIRYIVYDVNFMGDPIADLLFFLGGMFLFVGAALLGQIMMGER